MDILDGSGFWRSTSSGAIPPVPPPVIIVGGGGGYALGRYAERMTLAEWWRALWGKRLKPLEKAENFVEAVEETDEDLIDLILGL